MYTQIVEYKNADYEIHKNGLFWQTYIYKKEANLNCRLIDIVRSLVKPEIELIHEIIGRTESAFNQLFLESKELIYPLGGLF
jgi:hypothetical protein